MGGSTGAANCVLLHPECHDRVHRQRLLVSKPRLHCDQIVSLEDAWGESGRSLRERLLAAPTPAAKFRVFEDLLLDHFKPGLDRGIEYAIEALRGGVPVSQLAWRLGLLPRTLARRFLAEVGITPKRFARVQRLQRVLRAIRGSSSPIGA